MRGAELGGAELGRAELGVLVGVLLSGEGGFWAGVAAEGFLGLLLLELLGLLGLLLTVLRVIIGVGVSGRLVVGSLRGHELLLLGCTLT